MKGAFYTLHNSQLEVKPRTRFKLGLVTDWKSDMTRKKTGITSQHTSQPGVKLMACCTLQPWMRVLFFWLNSGKLRCLKGHIYTKYSPNLQMYIIFPVVKNGDLLVLVLLNMHFSLSSNCLAGCSGYFDGFKNIFS